MKFNKKIDVLQVSEPRLRRQGTKRIFRPQKC